MTRDTLRKVMALAGPGRSFIIASGLLFLLLTLVDAIHPAVAVVSFLVLSVVAMTKMLLAEDDVPTTLDLPTIVEKETGLLSERTALALLDHLPDPLFVVDGTGRLLFANKEATGLVGVVGTGRHFATVLRSAPLVTAINEVLTSGGGKLIEYEIPVPVQRNYSAFVSEVNDESRDGERVLLVLLRDVTQARRVEAMRVDFVAFASHELKTPLASLSGFIDTLRGHAKDDPAAQERFLAIMADQAARMRALIDDLLSLSRIELREHVRPSQTVDFSGVVDDVVDGLKPTADLTGMEIVVTGPEEAVQVRGDREELSHMVQNLAANALRYGKTGKRVELNLATGERGGKPVVRMSVRDYGIGIPKEHLPRLTERFYRVDAAASRAKGGTGLGLAIVKHIVNRHEGFLSIESELGQGSVFTVTLPLETKKPG